VWGESRKEGSIWTAEEDLDFDGGICDLLWAADFGENGFNIDMLIKHQKTMVSWLDMYNYITRNIESSHVIFLSSSVITIIIISVCFGCIEPPSVGKIKYY
jgi:hypothetical protein